MGTFYDEIENCGCMVAENDLAQLKKLIHDFVGELDTQAMPYVNEDLLGTSVLRPMSNADTAAGQPGFAVGSVAYDAEYSTRLRWEGTALKRSGQYLASAEKTIESFRVDGHYDLVNLRNLWKTALCGGDLAGAIAIIRKAMETYSKYEIARTVEHLPYPPAEDLDDVLEALRSEASCETRLRAFSGNPDYVMPRAYSDMRSDLSASSGPASGSSNGSAQAQGGSGCYIATAVYGSHDAPEVVTLRAFRDTRLRGSKLGRTFIAFYYSVSPTLAKRLREYPRLVYLTKVLLDAIVVRLRGSA